MSWRLTLLKTQLRWLTKPMLARTPGPVEARRDMERAARFVFRSPPFLRCSLRSNGLHWISAGRCRPGELILYFHGGGFIAGSPRTHAGMLGRLSKLTELEICAPRYRLAPEAAFPAQFEDALAAWEQLAVLGYHPNDIVVGGDSAGGGLALALLSELCQRGTPPAGIFLFSPWVDLSLTGSSLSENERADPLLPVQRVEELVDYVLQGADPTDSRASPLFADFPGAPPALIQYSETEILRDDSVRMAARLRNFGAEVTEEKAEDAPHVWQLFDGWIPEARESLTSAARFIQSCLEETKRNPNASAM